MSAAQDFKEAQFSLGAAYAAGMGVPQDSVEGLKWMILAGGNGLAYSMLTEQMSASDIEKARASVEGWLDAFDIKQTGDALASDEMTMVARLTDLSSKGMRSAQFELGQLYLRGLPYAVEVAKARRERGLPDRRTGLERGLDPNNLSRNRKPDPARAMQLFFSAAEQGHVAAQVMYARGLSTGNGVVVDTAAAAKWYLRAADRGDSEAQYELAEMYAR